MHLLYALAITILGIYPREMETIFIQNLCYTLQSSIIIITKKSKQPKCPSVGEQINTLQYIQMIE